VYPRELIYSSIKLTILQQSKSIKMESFRLTLQSGNSCIHCLIEWYPTQVARMDKT